ncbi:two-transmembrane helix containing protein [Aeromonas phage vB_AspA_Tola]|nr:two-transmembrane helix containing protein [Aeromonas phage vB_AspA_Tola]
MTTHTLQPLYPATKDDLPAGRTTRAVYLTPDANPLKQQLTTNNVAQTVTLNGMQWTSNMIDVNLASGVFTFLAETGMMLSASVQIIRETSGGGNLYWSMFVETSPDGAVWTPYPGTIRKITIPGSEVNEVRLVDFTLAVKGLVGEKFRFRHVTDRADKAVSIVSLPAAGALPSSAGVIVSALGVSLD